MASLTRVEAAQRAARIVVDAYEIDLDLDGVGETYRTRTVVRFRCLEDGASTFVEHRVPRLHAARLDGAALDLAAVFHDERIHLDGLGGTHVLETEADAAYSANLDGMHRIVDPEDGATYLFTSCFIDSASRVFACFDQPDLKARVSLRVQAPRDWTVIANGAGEVDASGRWTFATTQPISTYLVSLHAGPFIGVTSEHDGIPLGLWCRRSMVRYLDAEALFAETARSFDQYHRRFGVRYPFGKYDQVFVPEFSGAMEHPGCVTYDDDFLYRPPVTSDALEQRREFIDHEMAHMWFGDLVTMRWWDDLWLNESFADFISNVALAEDDPDALNWATFALRYKVVGYRADQLPSTHPIAGDVPDVVTALMNFDAISYQKGAGVLKQLATWLGQETFELGLRRYFARHAFGNTSLSDLVEALTEASGQDVSAWADRWLRTAGVSTLRPVIATDGDRYAEVSIVQTADPQTPTLRPHRLGIGLYDRRGDRLVLRERLLVDVDGPRTIVPGLAGAVVPDLLLLNDGDLTWAKVRFDDRSLATALDGGVARLETPLARALGWMTLHDMTRDAELPVGRYVAATLDAVAAEPEITIVELLLARAQGAIELLGRPDLRDDRLAALTDTCFAAAEAAAPGSDHQVAFVKGAMNAAIRPDQVDRLMRWLAGDDLPMGFVDGPETRWALVRRLAILGRIDDAGIAAEVAQDPTSAGLERAAHARATRPTTEAKRQAWEDAIGRGSPLSLATRRRIARGFWRPEQSDLVRPWRDRYVEDVRPLWQPGQTEVASTISAGLFPSSLIEPETVAMTDAALARTDLPDAFRRVLAEGRSELVRALATRAADD